MEVAKLGHQAAIAYIMLNEGFESIHGFLVCDTNTCESKCTFNPWLLEMDPSTFSQLFPSFGDNYGCPKHILFSMSNPLDLLEVLCCLLNDELMQKYLLCHLSNDIYLFFYFDIIVNNFLLLESKSIPFLKFKFNIFTRVVLFNLNDGSWNLGFSGTQ